ncbi:hypothetical protein BU15DRAFT_73531 [Melanogaster broomeanus]|nr:hypothetical protein BU15DRAFT_73531 [Melanogaster broomeanus]
MVLLNDRACPVVSRHITLLLTLATIPDVALAADIALHFWNSVFLPAEYRIQISHLITTFLQESSVQPVTQPLGCHSTLTCVLTKDIVAHLYNDATSPMSVDQAQINPGSDTNTVIEAGKAHRATPEDIYGWLYFMLSDELRTFARRIRALPISFHVFGTDARYLSLSITEGELTAYGIPPTVRFDRVEASNILDPNYIGMQDVLEA